jgi:hypothetical protein
MTDIDLLTSPVVLVLEEIDRNSWFSGTTIVKYLQIYCK